MSGRAQARGERGQATVELALGILVLVTVMLFGIHFAEVSFFELKVQEAANAALWDATSGQMHSWPFNDGPASTTVSTSGTKTNLAYQDFDGRSGTSGSSTVTNLMAQVSNMQVKCQTGVGFGAKPINVFTMAQFPDNGGMSCTASADIDATPGMPQHFLEKSGGGFDFHQQEYVPRTIKACGVGRPSGVNGPCNGQYQMLVDDWGFSGLSSSESNICPAIPILGVCAGFNMPFYTSMATAFALNGLGQGIAADQFAFDAVGFSPYIPDENIPVLSFMGEQTLFTQPVVPTEGNPVWNTTPFLPEAPTYAVAYGMRLAKGGCYLGLSCSPP